MKYLYQSLLDDDKNLRYIDWFVEHIDEYHFSDEADKQKADFIVQHINQKNIYYALLKKYYLDIIHHFPNNPYDYKYDVFDIPGGVETPVLKNYIIYTENKDPVSVDYRLQQCHERTEMQEVQAQFNKLLQDSQRSVVNQLNAIEYGFRDYMDSGVKEAVEQYKLANCGKNYKFIANFICYGIYNFLLFSSIREAGLLTIIYTTLFNGFHLISNIESLFTSLLIPALMMLALIVYFIYLDGYYGYKLFYTFYLNNKYNYVYKHYMKVNSLHNIFARDYNQAIGKIEQTIQKANHRQDYISLIKESKKRFSFRLKNPKNGQFSQQLPRYLHKNSKYPLISKIIYLLMLLIMIVALRFYI